MVQTKDIPITITEEHREPVDLLSKDFQADGTSGADSGGKLYTVKTDTEEVELTIEQLLELARICLTANSGSHSIAGDTAEASLSDVPELLEFVKNYPEVREFPPEVEKQIRGGKHPLDAYRSYENELLRNKLRAFEQNENNKKSSMGSVKSQAGAADELDDLMAIYNSVFK